MTQDVCEVHGVPLLDDAIPVFEAVCVRQDPKYLRIERLLFPHTRTFVWGMGLPDPYPVRYCGECRSAQAAWRESPGGWEDKADRAEAAAVAARLIPVIGELGKYGIGPLAHRSRGAVQDAEPGAAADGGA